MSEQEKQKIRECCFKNIDKAVRVGRCSYICPECKKDVSLMWFFYQQALDK